MKYQSCVSDPSWTLSTSALTVSHENDTVQLCSHYHQAYHILSQESTLNMACTNFSQTCQNGLHRVSVKHAEKYVKHCLHQVSVKHARMACTTVLSPSFCKTCQNGLHKVSAKHAKKYVKHGLHQISVKHARKAAACRNSHNCTCFFPCWIKASRCQKTCGFHAGSRLHTPSVKASSVTKRHEGRCLQVPRLPRNTTFDVATPATQNAG